MIGLCDELQQSLTQASKEQAPAHRKMIDGFVSDQFEMRQSVQEAKRKKNTGKRTEDGIMAWYFFQQFHSPRFWNTVEKARDRFKRVRGKMGPVKEQIMIVMQ